MVRKNRTIFLDKTNIREVFQPLYCFDGPSRKGFPGARRYQCSQGVKLRITTRGQLAVSAMTDLAMRQNTAPVALSTISARQGTSLSYLEQLFSALKRAGLVDSTRGPGGGYALAHKPEQVSVADIVLAVENHKPGEEAAPAANGSSQMVTMTGSLLSAFNARVLEYLQSVTLRDLVAEQQARGVRVESPVVTRTKLARRPAPLMARAGVPNSVFALGAVPALARK